MIIILMEPQKLLLHHLSNTIRLVFDGTCIEYFPDGKRKRTSQYKGGDLFGSQTNYYPNGKLYSILKIDNPYYGFYAYRGYRVQIIELRDLKGNLLASNGTGHVIIYDDDFKNVLNEGDLKNNKREGQWRGSIADSGAYICTYHKDELKSGISYMKSGNHYKFDQIDVRAVFSDGRDAFYFFLKKNLQYPEVAKKHNTKGSVLVGFYVETNGTLSDVKIVRGLLKSLDDEALRVVGLSPLWIPASTYGVPRRTYNQVSVDFY